MIIRPIILSIIFFYLLSSCSNTNKTGDNTVTETPRTLKSLKWPIGKYLEVTPEGMTFEEWVRVDSFNYKGKTFTIDKKTNDTSFTMTYELKREIEKTTLSYFIKGLSKGNGTEFILTKEDNELYVFENPFHDFNSIMQYRILGDTAIEITELGFVNNREREKRHHMKKID